MRNANNPIIPGDEEAAEMLFLPDAPHLFWPPGEPNNPNRPVPGIPGNPLFEYLIRQMLVPGGGK
jgi:hypothetical protein